MTTIVKAANRPTLGFIGMGTMNRGHLGHFLGQKDVQVLAVCDVDTTRREAAKKTVESRYADAIKSGTYKGCNAYNDFNELLTSTDPLGRVTTNTYDSAGNLLSTTSASGRVQNFAYNTDGTVDTSEDARGL